MENKLRDNIRALKIMNPSEESTKNFLIYPFFEYMGYDMRSPSQVTYEYVCDIHEHGNRKVDFAIFCNGRLKIICEAKAMKEELANHTGQLKSYFMSSMAAVAVLTNGLEYYVYTRDQIDSYFINKLPKYIFDLRNLSMLDEEAIRVLRNGGTNVGVAPNGAAAHSAVSTGYVSVGGYKVGDYIKHVKFGDGFVSNVVNNNVSVDFVNVGLKTLTLPFNNKHIIK